jgi:hypothetical protein
LQPALQKPNSNQAVVELLLDLVTDMAGGGQLSPDYSLKPKKVSALWNFKEDVHSDVVALAGTEKVIKAMPENIRRKVIPCLVNVVVDDMIENLRNPRKNICSHLLIETILPRSLWKSICTRLIAQT